MDQDAKIASSAWESGNFTFEAMEKICQKTDVKTMDCDQNNLLLGYPFVLL